jgi:teichuronic acid exporter
MGIICLSAISRPFADAASQMLVAIDKADLDLMSSFIFTIVFAIGLLIGVHWGVLGVAISVLLTHAVFQSIFTLWATRYVFKRFNGLETI